MALLAGKLVHFLKLPFKLRRFRSKTSVLLLTLKPEMMPMALWFHNCFEMVHAANTAFAELVAEIEYPMSRWGAAAAHHYLAYTLTLLDMLNSITSRLSHLNMLKLSMLHGVTLVENSPNSAPKHVMKIDRSGGGGDFKVGKYLGIGMRAGSKQKEGVIIEALMEMKKMGLFALGLVLWGLWNDAEAGGCDDDRLKKVFCREMKGVVEEEVSCAGERLAAAISAGECDEAVRELEGRMEVVENAIMAIENEANRLFFQVLAARNTVLDNIRFA